MRHHLFFCLATFSLFFSLIELLFSCNQVKRNNKHPKISDESIVEGKRLSSLYCQSCHLLPEPSLLDSKTWEKGVLPQMAPRLGIFEFNYQRYPYVNDGVLKDYYPTKPVITNEQWQNIINYYIASAPDSLSKQKHENKIAEPFSLFSPELPSFTYNNPSSSYIKIEQKASSQDLIVCDLFKQTIYQYDKKLKIVDSMISSGAIVDMDLKNEGMLTCNIGTLNPTNYSYGEARYIKLNSKGKMQKEKTPLFKNLTRPVQITSADLNKDGKTDFVVCEFGYLKGALSWMENTGTEQFERHVIRNVAGAVKVYVEDYNHDGLEDLWVLFAQGEEGIFLFTNKGNGNFDEQEILRFPSVYGSSYFELKDFNNDGYSDIVYTCGDNADYSNTLKPYHGVYVFLNDGNNHFKQQFFFPVNGCYKAIARDFDNDGDIDIATIAYFADFSRHPEEGFIYLENEGKFTFKQHTLPETQKGRWMTMDAGDLDGDGDIDIVLGNFSLGPVMMRSKSDWTKGPPFILLKNTGK